MAVPTAETMLQMLKNREQIIRTILADVESCGKNFDAFEKLEALYESGGNVSAEKALSACAISLRHLNEVNRRVLMLLLVYVSGNHFAGDTATVLAKMGRGDEAIREMFRQKMNGR